MSKDFKWPYKVTISDINYGGHMGNDRSLALFHEARIAYLKSMDCTELNIGDGLGIILKDAHISFLAEIFHGDDLEVYVRFGEIKGLLFKLNYEVVRKSDGKVALKGETGILAFNYQSRKVARIPLSLLNKIEEIYGH